MYIYVYAKLKCNEIRTNVFNFDTCLCIPIEFISILQKPTSVFGHKMRPLPQYKRKGLLIV